MIEKRLIGAVEVPTCFISGKVDSRQSLNGCISQEAKVTGNLATAYTTSAKPYEGDYEVTPTVDGLRLETKQKYMTDDVTILAIPFFEVGNTSGGNTVFIADGIEME